MTQNNGRIKTASIITGFCLIFAAIVASWATQKGELIYQSKQLADERIINASQTERIHALETNWAVIERTQQMIISQLKQINDKIDNQNVSK